ncbi:MAG: 50S ribosomal protein L4, partial [Chitinophagaceae bacterium]|nr:50S ribosomal protein L4 [Chitinophagaceae bacterium]
NNLQLNNAKVLFLMAEENDNLYLSSRNLPKVKTDIFYNTNTYDVLNASKLLLTENVVKQFSESEMEEVA